MEEKPIKLVWVDPSTLEENPQNWRIHPEDQETALDALIFGKEAVGWAGALLVNDRRPEKGWAADDCRLVLIDGHDRRKLAIERGADVPALVGSWTPNEEKIILATLDPIANMARPNSEMLEALIMQTSTNDPDINRLMDDVMKMFKENPEDHEKKAPPETILDQAVQIIPPVEYIVIVCPDPADFDAVKDLLDLRMVRRGGYRPTSPFDDIGLERVIPADRLLDAVKAAASRRPEPAD